MEIRRFLRAIKYLNLEDIEKAEKLIDKRKKELNNVVARAGDTVELLYPEDHRMSKLDGRHVKIESINNGRHLTSVDSISLAFQKSRIKRVVKKGR